MPALRTQRYQQKAQRAWNVAESLRRMMRGKDKLRHKDAVFHIRATFGEEFLYRNRNGNLVISLDVLNIFEMFTDKKVVWAKYGRFWRPRRSGDPAGKRMVAY